jgi:predicted RNase H-like HicB family nuclease
MKSGAMRKIKIVVERHADGYVAYPLDLRNGIAIVGQGESYEEALADVTSAIKFTLDSSSESEIFDDELPAMEVFVAEIEIPVNVQVSR